MREPDFLSLTRQLRAAGFARRHAERTTVELKDHYEDLVADLCADGWNPAAAHAEAARQLGDLSIIGKHFERQTRLRAWPYRYPAIARMALPVACLAVLPVTPLIAGWYHASVVMRWGCALLAGAAFTAILMGVLQMSLRLA